jgi:hypothetical protein
LAGAAAAGAAGSIVMGAIPAAATQGSALLMGTTTNDASLTTQIFPTATASPVPAPLFEATGQSVTVPTTIAPTASITPPVSQSIPLVGAIGPGGSLPPNPTTGLPDYPGFAPIQGVGGSTTIGTKTYSEGLNGWGGGQLGIGVTGDSDHGYGLAGLSGGIDVAALGNGRIMQLPLFDNLLTSPPFGPPNYTNPNDFEQVRDGRGVLWLSGVSGTWRRANTLRFDTPNGLAAFRPARILDTRNSTGTPGSSPGLGANQPLQPGQVYTFGPFTNSNGIPADAIGIVGNVTVVNFTGAGYVALFPGGVADPGVSTLNFGGEFASSGWANAFTLGFGTGANAGKISIKLSNNGITSHVIVDVTGYVQ